MTDMIASIVAELTIELKNETDFDADILNVKVLNAYREVQAAKNYPSTYSEEMIQADMAQYFGNIRAIALYDYSKLGAEGQSQYSGDGESIHYLDRNKLFTGVYPIARV